MNPPVAIAENHTDRAGPERRPSKRIKDLADIARLVEVHADRFTIRYCSRSLTLVSERNN